METLAWGLLVAAVGLFWWLYGSEFLGLVDPVRVPVDPRGVEEFHWRTVQIQEEGDE